MQLHGNGLYACMSDARVNAVRMPNCTIMPTQVMYSRQTCFRLQKSFHGNKNSLQIPLFLVIIKCDQIEIDLGDDQLSLRVERAMSPHFQTALENIMLQRNNITIILDFPSLFFTEDASHDGKENGSTLVRDTRFFKFYHIPISSFNQGIHQFFFDVTRLILIEVL